MRIIVLFNLRPDADVTAYEEWARTRDLPGIRALVSVSDFQLLRSTGLLGGGGEPAYQYVGIIHVNDREGFDRDMGSEAIRTLSAEFERFADNPQIIVTEALSEVNP